MSKEEFFGKLDQPLAINSNFIVFDTDRDLYRFGTQSDTSEGWIYFYPRFSQNKYVAGGGAKEAYGADEWKFHISVTTHQAQEELVELGIRYELPQFKVANDARREARLNPNNLHAGRNVVFYHSEKNVSGETIDWPAFLGEAKEIVSRHQTGPAPHHTRAVPDHPGIYYRNERGLNGNQYQGRADMTRVLNENNIPVDMAYNLNGLPDLLEQLGMLPKNTPLALSNGVLNERNLQLLEQSMGAEAEEDRYSQQVAAKIAVEMVNKNTNDKDAEGKFRQEIAEIKKLWQNKEAHPKKPVKKEPVKKKSQRPFAASVATGSALALGALAALPILSPTEPTPHTAAENPSGETPPPSPFLPPPTTTTAHEVKPAAPPIKETREESEKRFNALREKMRGSTVEGMYTFNRLVGGTVEEKRFKSGEKGADEKIAALMQEAGLDQHIKPETVDLVDERRIEHDGMPKGMRATEIIFYHQDGKEIARYDDLPRAVDGKEYGHRSTLTASLPDGEQIYVDISHKKPNVKKRSELQLSGTTTTLNGTAVPPQAPGEDKTR